MHAVFAVITFEFGGSLSTVTKHTVFALSSKKSHNNTPSHKSDSGFTLRDSRYFELPNFYIIWKFSFSHSLKMF